MSSDRASTGRALAERLPRVLFGLGVLLSALLVGEVVNVVFRPEPIDLIFLVGVASSLPFIVGLAGGGYWLRHSELSAERYGRVGWWCVGGGSVFVLVNLGLIAAMLPATLAVLIGWLR